jgi:nucleoside-diphosphate-sugar epimerase
MRPPATPRRRPILLALAELALSVPPALSFGSTAVAVAGCPPPASSLGMAAAAAAVGGGGGTSGGVAIYGCGVLGTSLCRQLMEDPTFSSQPITGITRTDAKHDSIRSMVLAMGDGAAGRLNLETEGSVPAGTRFRDLVFCAPPSGFEDYPAAVEDALGRYWDAGAGGTFVLTGAGSVYGDGDGETVAEDSPTCDPVANPRAARMLGAERSCLGGGGGVLRLAGLYTLTRGAHNYWLTSGKPVQGNPDGTINLLHYDDAAGACLAALKKGPKVVSGRTFLISDGHPTTRRGICESAVKAAHYRDAAIPEFAGGSDLSRGKIYDGSASDAALGWKPLYESFDSFMASQN